MTENMLWLFEVICTKMLPYAFEMSLTLVRESFKSSKYYWVKIGVKFSERHVLHFRQNEI